jgi:hypothetical protein
MAVVTSRATGPEGQVTVMRKRRSRYRERSGGRKFARFLVFVVALALVLFSGFVLQRDLRVDRTLSQRGLIATGTLDSTGCWLCRAVGVTYATATGQKVVTIVTAIGPQADRTITLKYDPRHPKTVEPAHGVREEEIIVGVVLLLSLVALLRSLRLPRRRHKRRRGARIRTRGLSGGDATGHVRILGS